MPVLPPWLTEPLWDQFAALLPDRLAYVPTHQLGYHRPRISDRIVFDKMLQLLRFGCSYQAIADTTCSATTIRSRRDEWIRFGIFTRLKQIALDSYERSSASSLIRSPSTAPSPRHPAAARSPDAHRWTAGNRV
ncbi:putative transposase IS4/IS5 family [Actinobacteria bacterium OV320]|nr:putative transposase IS4/IS5 family [Actinobacteria bacterium OV320]